MGKTNDSITEQHQVFIEKQHMFFVGTAPLSAQGHVNISPKGLDTFKIISPTRVAYLDLVGSGNETSAHAKENGRITFMFCSFEKVPNIMRLYGQGSTVLPTDKEWPELLAHFRAYQGIRQIIVADIHRVQTSCGYGIPFFEYKGERDTLLEWADRKGPEGLEKYKSDNNRHSMDGLPTPLSAI